jgi:hypothetical protein
MDVLSSNQNICIAEKWAQPFDFAQDKQAAPLPRESA